MGIDLEVKLFRMYGEKRSDDLELVEHSAGEILFAMDINVNRPPVPNRIYEVEGIRFRGVSPVQMMADKVAVTKYYLLIFSSEKGYNMDDNSDCWTKI